MFEKNQEEFYLTYLSDTKATKIPQTNYMSAGSAFDGFVKSALHKAIFGAGVDPRFEFQTLFEEQVEPHNRDWALVEGQYIFDSYKLSGAYDELLGLLSKSAYAPQFEFKIEGTIQNIPLLGKPDLRFVHESGAHIILDWKVSGYCSKSATSPCKYYRMVRDGWNDAKPSLGCNRSHKEFEPATWKGVEIYKGWLEDTNTSWADQLAIYAWMLGEPVGDENVIVCIDQIVAKPTTARPLLRVANFRSRISASYQKSLLSRIQACWKAISDEHIFIDMTKEESQERCAMLDRQALFTHLDTPEQKIINSLTRSTKCW
jgi:hypothetical protein